jgi:hypothetical protein
MKKHKRNTTLHAGRRHNTPLVVRRETVRVLAGEDLALIAAGSTTILTERPTTKPDGLC